MKRRRWRSKLISKRESKKMSRDNLNLNKLKKKSNLVLGEIRRSKRPKSRSNIDSKNIMIKRRPQYSPVNTKPQDKVLSIIERTQLSHQVMKS